MKFCFNTLILCLFISIHSTLDAQENSNKIPSNIGISLEFGFASPSADLATRFGNHTIAGTGLYWYNAPLNLRYGVSFDYLFGIKVNEDPISNLRNENGVFLGLDNNYATVLLRMRGILLDAVVTKTFPILKNNRSTGIEIGIGAGIMQHKIRIQPESNNIPLFTNETVRGYDRNTIGPSIKQIVGFHWRAIKSNANMSLLLEVTEGFTSPTNPVDFNTGNINNDSRLDIDMAVKLAYYLPLKRKVPVEEIYY